MSRRRDIDRHRTSLGEIRDIMNSMKNLSYMEMRKLSGFLDVQHAVVEQMETVATDFLSFYDDTEMEAGEPDVAIYLLIGTERGFCADFNQHLLRFFEAAPTPYAEENTHLVVMGHKLESLLLDDARVLSVIPGASVYEEVDDTLCQLVSELTLLQKRYGAIDLRVIYHDDEQHVLSRQILPPFQEYQQAPIKQVFAPDLTMQPLSFFGDLSYHYLYFVLHEILYTSLMSESRQRVTHLDASVQRMDEQLAELKRQSNVLRQEEIIEEIEVILLSSSSCEMNVEREG